MTPAQITLPAADAAELAQHEAVIERGLQTFYEVGTALLAIRDKRLYRADYSTFEDYCRERWQLKQSRAYQLMDAANVMTNLQSSTIVELPTNESQVRQLTQLDEEAQRLAWEVVQQTAPAGKVTAAHVKSVVSVLKGVVTTGAIDNGTGESVPVVADVLKAAVTEETYERMRRQEAHMEQARVNKVAQEQARALRIEQALKPDAKYRVIYADPPWSYGNTMPGYYTEQAHHYDLMSLDAICNMPVASVTEDHAVLFLWTTSPMLEDAFRVIKAWGFTYKSSFVWDKVKHNMGHYNSVRHEFLLICTRGSCVPDVQKLFDSVQSIERSDTHSQKPSEFRQIIDTLYPNGKRLELFAREKPDGWDVYGNQIPGQ